MSLVASPHLYVQAMHIFKSTQKSINFPVSFCIVVTMPFRESYPPFCHIPSLETTVSAINSSSVIMLFSSE